MNKNKFVGRCHCGNVSLVFSTGLAINELAPRACDCSFCVEQGASWLSDPAGSLDVVIKDSHLLRHEQQGSGSAKFTVCGTCDALMYATYEKDSVTYAGLNSSCLKDRDRMPVAVVVSPQSLSREDKIARWLNLWTPCSITLGEFMNRSEVP